MNVHAAALAKAHRFDDRTSAFASDVIEGLAQQPKRLSPKYFYDVAGSELFEQITLLPEYYPTRTELGILRDRGAEIANIVPQGAALVEFGAGCDHKSPAAARPVQIRRLCAGGHLRRFPQCAGPRLEQGFPGARRLPGDGGFHRAIRAAGRGEGDAEGRIFPGLDAGKFRTP